MRPDVKKWAVYGSCAAATAILSGCREGEPPTRTPLPDTPTSTPIPTRVETAPTLIPTLVIEATLAPTLEPSPTSTPIPARTFIPQPTRTPEPRSTDTRIPATSTRTMQPLPTATIAPTVVPTHTQAPSRVEKPSVSTNSLTRTPEPVRDLGNKDVQAVLAVLQEQLEDNVQVYEPNWRPPSEAEATLRDKRRGSVFATSTHVLPTAEALFTRTAAPTLAALQTRSSIEMDRIRQATPTPVIEPKFRPHKDPNTVIGYRGSSISLERLYPENFHLVKAEGEGLRWKKLFDLGGIEVSTRAIISPDSRFIGVNDLGLYTIYDEKGQPRSQVCCKEKGVFLWRFPQGEYYKFINMSLENKPGAWMDFDFTPDSKNIVSTTTQGLGVYNIESSRLDNLFNPGFADTRLRWARTSPQGLILSSSVKDRALGLWRWGTNKMDSLGTFDPRADSTSPDALKFNPKGDRLALIRNSGNVEVVDMETKNVQIYGRKDGYQAQSLDISDRYLAISYYHDAEKAMTKKRSGLRIINLESKQEVWSLTPAATSGAVAFYPGGESIAWALGDEPMSKIPDRVLFYNLRGERVGALPYLLQDPSITFTRDGGYMVIGSHYKATVWQRS